MVGGGEMWWKGEGDVVGGGGRCDGRWWEVERCGGRGREM